MLKRWFLYFLALFGVVAFYGIYEGYLSYYIMICVVLFPIFSLLISLFSMMSAEAELSPLPSEIRRGEQIDAYLEINLKGWFPLSRSEITYISTNITFNDINDKDMLIVYGCKNEKVPLPVESNHIGCLYINILKIRVFDFLGLFSISLKVPEKRRVTVMPELLHPNPTPILPTDKIGGKGMKPKPGGGFAEDYDLREYRIGDPLNSIHWKLTSKLDEIIIREPLISEKGKIFICFNLFGTAEELDSVFAQVAYISKFFLSRMIEFSFCWYVKDGTLVISEVDEQTDYIRIMSTIFTEQIGITGKPIDEYACKQADWYYIVKPDLPNEVNK